MLSMMNASFGANCRARSLNVRVVEYPDRLIEEEKAQPDNCTPTEITEQMAVAPTYLNWLLKHG